VRWLDGAIATAAKLAGDRATVVAAGDPTWLDLAADRSNRAGLASAGVATDLRLDYLGWAQIVAAVVRQLASTLVIVDEASRPDRRAEVAAIAELLDAAQLTRVVDVDSPGPGLLHATRLSSDARGGTYVRHRIERPAVVGVTIAGPAIDEYPTPTPSAAMKRLDLKSLGLDPVVLGHRAVVPRSPAPPRTTVERVAELLAAYRVVQLP
jgi:electron transfer flavoprotein alpha/beta subunit